MGGASLRFGTDGWRAVTAEGYTFANVRRLAVATARVALERGGVGARVLVGYDTRFLSDRFAAAAAQAMRSAGVEALLAAGPVPTPALSLGVRDRGATLGVMITASHNPPEWNGFKLKGPYGGPALGDLVAAVEAAVPSVDPGGVPGGAGLVGTGFFFDPLPAYRARLSAAVDLKAIAGAGLRVAVDAMHGSAGGLLVELLRGAGVEVIPVRIAPDPLFGGLNPEPIPANLGPLAEAVRESGADVGVCTDGDADRVGAVDAAGSSVDAQHLFALLLRHLVEVRGERGAVVKTFAVSEMIDALAQRHGLPLSILPVGFKHVAARMLQADVLIGGEEAGGIGMGRHLPERDGPLCCLLLLEAMARTRKGLGALVAALHREVGPHYYGRLDLREASARIPAEPPREVAGLAVSRVDRLDGLKVFCASHGWVLWRASGTEPLVRVYAELDDPGLLTQVLAVGRDLALG